MRPAGAIVALALLAAACTDIDTGPNVAASIEFTALPFPAVVAGDTLRDTSGVAAQLRAAVFNTGNDEIVDAPVRYAALETVVTVDSVTGVVVAGANADTTARLLAYVGSLQAAPLRLSVVPRPDSVEPSGAIDTLRYSVIDTTRNLSADLAVRVLHHGPTNDVPVRDWIVTFALANAADSVRARVVGDNGRPSALDTTSTAGIAARKVRLFPAGLTSPRDSIIVLARVRYRGMHVAGSPLRLVLPVVPRVP
ncbi:MAG: hypothetical protein ACSLFE_09740 [Gemmatimonadaceae bacterium]